MRGAQWGLSRSKPVPTSQSHSCTVHGIIDTIHNLYCFPTVDLIRSTGREGFAILLDIRNVRRIQIDIHRTFQILTLAFEVMRGYLSLIILTTADCQAWDDDTRPALAGYSSAPDDRRSRSQPGTQFALGKPPRPFSSQSGTQFALGKPPRPFSSQSGTQFALGAARGKLWRHDTLKISQGLQEEKKILTLISGVNKSDLFSPTQAMHKFRVARSGPTISPGFPGCGYPPLLLSCLRRLETVPEKASIRSFLTA
ncbi:hypothetical protein RRG08_033472 [Elysia crispata]|uniref:Uncharacterized protein n=1 Tax=Elysia crispata TaxID=231223 RepID=A0AAE1AV62_9GAST|nr:hypothetical protein RRG08_033472 [Elysia crispata]